jgi:hypothetical protein
VSVRRGCHAAWYELNVSAPDDCVSACCYYAGEKDAWSDEARSVEDYWNSPRMLRLRAINADPEGDPGGCAGCFFFRNRGPEAVYAPEFLEPPADLSEAQRANWLAARDDFRNGRTRMTATPLRYYVNFGFACNLSCVMCHQVPRREANRRQARADLVLGWKEGLRRAFDVSVIGGEPFALPEAIRFIRAVAADPDLDAVELTILTNGTVHHKHLDTLLQKRKVRLVVSLDTIGAAFEKIRVGASFEQIERNILAFLEAGRRHGRAWRVQSSCLLLRTNLASLPAFAEWSAAHGIVPGFYDFIDARGIEPVFAAENVVAHPELLDGEPGWQEHFALAARRLRARGWEKPAAELDRYRVLIEANRRRRAEAAEARGRLGARAAWRSLYAWSLRDQSAGLAKNLYGRAGVPGAVALHPAGIRFTPTDLRDHLSTPYREVTRAPGGGGRWLRVRCAWPAATGPRPVCEVVLQDERCNPLEAAPGPAGAGSGDRIERYYALDPSVERVRVVMTAVAMEPVYAPVEIVLEEAAA